MGARPRQERWLRGLARRAGVGQRLPERGMTLAEVLIAVTLFAALTSVIGATFVLGFRTTASVEDRLARSLDAQLLSAYWAADVASLEPGAFESVPECQGEYPADTQITLAWNSAPDLPTTIITYAAHGEGDDSRLLRRVCVGASEPEEIVVARSFGVDGVPAAELIVGPPPPGETEPAEFPWCTTSECTIAIDSPEFDFSITAERRVPGEPTQATPPGPPVCVGAVSRNTEVEISWQPGSLGIGNHPISEYLIEVGLVTGPDSYDLIHSFAVPPEVTTYMVSEAPAGSPLVNGEEYLFWVRARNAPAGTGSRCFPGLGAVPAPHVPDPPQVDALTPGTLADDPATATVEWSLPPEWNDGGEPVTEWIVFVSDGVDVFEFDGIDPAASSATVGPLPLGRNYTATMAGVNAIGTGFQSSPSPSATLLPSPPVLGVPTGGNQTATVPFTHSDQVPAAEFRVVSDPGGVTVTGTSSPITVTGLTNGVSYTFTVQARNATGWGPFSPPSYAVTPSHLPTVAPTNLVVDEGDGQLTLTWDLVNNAPPANGGSDIVAYGVARSGGGPGSTQTLTCGGPCPSSGTLSHTFTGLNNGTSYSLFVWAMNANGSGPQASASGTPFGPPAPSAAPTLSPVDFDTMGASWLGHSPQGRPILEYEFEVERNVNGSWTAYTSQAGIAGTSTSFAADRHFHYRARVRARNDAGWGNWTSWSVQRASLPTAPNPAQVSGSAGDTQVSLSWPAPIPSGSNVPINQYQVQCNPSCGTTTTSATSATLTGLTNGTTYQFRVRVENPSGWGPWTAWTASTMPVGPPDAPNTNWVQNGNSHGQATMLRVNYTTVNNGGSPADYTVECRRSSNNALAGSVTQGAVPNGANRTVDVWLAGGMPVGENYYCRTRGWNAVGGNGPWSNSVTQMAGIQATAWIEDCWKSGFWNDVLNTRHNHWGAPMASQTQVQIQGGLSGPWSTTFNPGGTPQTHNWGSGWTLGYNARARALSPFGWSNYSGTVGC